MMTTDEMKSQLVRGLTQQNQAYRAVMKKQIEHPETAYRVVDGSNADKILCYCESEEMAKAVAAVFDVSLDVAAMYFVDKMFGDLPKEASNG